MNNEDRLMGLLSAKGNKEFSDIVSQIKDTDEKSASIFRYYNLCHVFISFHTALRKAFPDRGKTMKGKNAFRMWLHLRKKVHLRRDFSVNVWVAVARKTPGLVFEAPTLQKIADRLPVLEDDLTQ